MSKRHVLGEEAPLASVTSLDAARGRQALGQLTLTHGSYLHGLARKLCRSQLDPDDLVQDVLERTLRTPIPDGANERAWLSRVMHNLFIDKLRRRQARREELTADPIEAPREVERVWWEALGEAEVRAACAQLPDEQRATFELFAFDGRSYDQIAADQKIAKATVGTRILRARQKIRELLTRERGDA